MEIPEEYWTDALLSSMAGKYTKYATCLPVGDDITYWDTKRRLLTNYFKYLKFNLVAI